MLHGCNNRRSLAEAEGGQNTSLARKPPCAKSFQSGIDRTRRSRLRTRKPFIMMYSPIEHQLKTIKAAQAERPKDTMSILKAASDRALSGGLAGAGAMVVQVSTLMWMRTVMNYQYRHGYTTTQAIRILYTDGGGGLSGVLRFYKGFAPALLQGPLSRFGDTAANVGALALLDSYDATKGLPVGVKTLTASASAAAFRMFLMPVDCLKTTLQVHASKVNFN